MEKTDEISKFYKNNELELEKVIEKYTAYVYSIVKARVTKIRTEDAEEIISDVFLAVWNNRNKLDLNKSMSLYISGITKNLINKKLRNIRKDENITEYDENLIRYIKGHLFLEYIMNTILEKSLNVEIGKHIFNKKMHLLYEKIY